ncbi:NADP-dependent phosphogluconate dehydrogenase [uncultured Hymenobacter sp.]|uniref:NADP-dependent phosphogluconate dehydrogenase n=1 Tax=uncultured Hymenobacter sp. TaxID=170016 RepID=UPI0035CA69B9
MVFVVMGVAGSGKTTVGRRLAQALRLPFHDADDFHPAVNIEKMRGGQPLTDDDRRDWLAALAAGLREWAAGGGAVLACSALKEPYRAGLQAAVSAPIRWVVLDGARELIAARLAARTGHYLGAGLLDSQLAAFDKPAYGLHLPISASPEDLVNQILAHTYMREETIEEETAAEFGLIGLGVMGRSLALNLAEKGVRLALYNRHVPGLEEGVAEKVVTENAALGELHAFDELPAFVTALARPRKILLMVTAGAAVDAQIRELQPLLAAGDVLLDGGNSHYHDTARRTRQLADAQIHFLGTGISGGEEGARRGPALMPGGPRAGYELVAPYLDLLAARDQRGAPCAAYLGPDGAGHFVKMIHNGIEYAEMQLLAEVYQVLRQLQAPAEEMTAILRGWQAEEALSSYLLGITIDILQVKENGRLLLDHILDQAEQKGTGGWTVQAALDYAVPLSVISEAVLARVLSAHRAARVQAAARYPAPAAPPLPAAERQRLIGQLKNAYQAARLLNHASGFELLKAASAAEGWALILSEVARIWTGGCIIRSGLMEQLHELFKKTDDLLAAPGIVAQLQARRADFAALVGWGLQAGVALPAHSAALNYFLGLTTPHSPANLIQAQRDYFGAHTFRRTDRPPEEVFHADWPAYLAP